MVAPKHCERCFTSVRGNQDTKWGWLCNGCRVAVQQIVDFLEVKGYTFLTISPESDENASSYTEVPAE